MTIRQQGGVFGRHPKFDTIETDGNADIGGDLTSKSLTAENTVAGEYTGIVVNNPSTNAAAISTIELRGKRTNGSQNSFFLKNAGGLALEVKNQFGYKHASFDWLSADITLGGNLIVANGKGIDFSATSGTGTSELFDDYEEGTWTPFLRGDSGGGTLTYTTQTGYYTKIGNVVTVTFEMVIDVLTSAPAGGASGLGGIPFTSIHTMSDGPVEFSGMVGTWSTISVRPTSFPYFRGVAGSAQLSYGFVLPTQFQSGSAVRGKLTFITA